MGNPCYRVGFDGAGAEGVRRRSGCEIRVTEAKLAAARDRCGSMRSAAQPANGRRADMTAQQEAVDLGLETIALLDGKHSRGGDASAEREEKANRADVRRVCRRAFVLKGHTARRARTPSPKPSRAWLLGRRLATTTLQRCMVRAASGAARCGPC